MPQDPAAAVSALLRAATIDDHEEVLKAANAAIRANKSDNASQHTRVVALLKLDRFDDALRAIDEGGFKLEASCILEKAYALYKTGRLEEASKLVQATSSTHRSFKHIAAQVAYRAERFDEAQSVYNDLANQPGDEESDLNINLKAVLAQLVWQGNGPSYLEEEPPHDSFELCYNAACAYIARGALDKASSLLQRAVRLCDASDDLSDEDKQAEMQPILAQQAYVYARQGKLKEALDLYKSLDKTSVDDVDLNAIAQNNQAAIEPAPTNPFLFQRKAEAWLSAAEKAKLFRYQSSVLGRNALVVDLVSQKIDGVEKRTNKTLSKVEHPTASPDINTMSVLNAAAKTHGATDREALRQLSALSAKRPKDLGLLLTLIQAHLQQGQTGAAVAKLEAFLQNLDEAADTNLADVRLNPGLVALTVALLRAQGKAASAKAELVKAAEYWTTRPGRTASSLLREAGIELLRSSNAQDLALAGSAFEKLFKEHQGSPIDSAGLVASLAPTDPQRVQKHSAELPPVESLIGGVDVDSLIQAGVAAAPRSAAAVEASRKRPASDDAPEKATKKRRKRKLPKNYEAGKTPDPERWLPLRDRSSYRPKGRKGKKKAGESTQGGIVKEEETLELVGGGGVKVERAAGGGTAANKKKKKGKK